MRQHGNTGAIDLSYVSYAYGEHLYGGWYRCVDGTIELIALGCVIREFRGWDPPLKQARCMLRRLVEENFATARGATLGDVPPPSRVAAQCCKPRSMSNGDASS